MPSFSGDVKNELARLPLSKECCERAELAGLLRMGASLTLGANRALGLAFSTEHAAVARRTLVLLREAGAKEIHMRVSAPPFLFPCYYGTDIDSSENLIASKHTVEEIAAIIGADSLGYLPLDQLCELAGSHEYCSACFSGSYPTAISLNVRKDLFDRFLSEI